jgi:hypothetical protein
LSLDLHDFPRHPLHPRPEQPNAAFRPWIARANSKYLYTTNSLGLISNFLKIEKEHITNQNLFKTVMDYKYPFEAKPVVLKDEDEDGKNTHWSVSTLHQMSEIEILSKWAQEENKSGELVRNPNLSRSQVVNSIPMDL